MRRWKNKPPRTERAGEWLYQAHRHRDRFGPLPEDLAPRSVTEAYAIQSELVGMRGRDLGAVVGYKIALTTPAMRKMVGLDDSIAGDMLERTVLRSPASVHAGDYARLLVEFEIAFELGEDLPAVGAPYTREKVAQAVAAAMPALELADDRNADYAQLPANALMLIADNAWNEGAVLGAPAADWKEIDLGALKGVASVDGKVVGEGHGRDVMGHPLEALAWLANLRAGQGQMLKAGAFVSLGSIVETKWIAAGDLVEVAIEGFGRVSAQFSAT
jgi:2-keto-4-pentenoate hydratase